MSKGEKARLEIEPEWAYGKKGQPDAKYPFPFIAHAFLTPFATKPFNLNSCDSRFLCPCCSWTFFGTYVCARLPEEVRNAVQAVHQIKTPFQIVFLMWITLRPLLRTQDTDWLVFSVTAQ